MRIAGRRGWLLATLGVTSVSGAAAAASLVGIRAGGLPWIPQALIDRLGAEPFALWQIVGFVSAFTGALAASSFVRRAGAVELTSEVISLERRFLPRVSVRWHELAGFSDASPAYVQLLGRGRGARLAIPTLTEEHRTAVLAALIEHGIARKEAGRLGRLVWALALAVVVVGAMTAALFAANRDWRLWGELLAGTLPREEADALLARSFRLRPELRPAIGSEDALAAGMTFDVGGAGFFVTQPRVPLFWHTFMLVDGNRASEQTFDWRQTLGARTRFDARRCAVHLAPGKHVVTLETEARVDGVSGVVATCTSRESATFEVVPGSLAGSIATEHRPGAVAAITATATADPEPDIELDELPREATLTGRLVVLEGENELYRGDLLHRSTATTILTQGSRFSLPGVAKGKHVFVVRFTPDAHVAFENMLDATSILDEPFERRVELEVK